MAKPEISRGMAAVALMALSKREFFSRLLDDPEQAVAEVRADLELTDGEVDEVVAAVREGRRDMTRAEAEALWDGWRATGRWGPAPPPPWPSLMFWPK